MAYGVSNGHMTWKVKLVSHDPNMLRAQYLENGDAI